ncbi:type II CAAX prenyl endopeptidase Rce1 family protein [uncultured Methanobrevibacter sp.]|uniref:CPBP family glutamic-type intramembrane protease n=1 Tax=uncultured Methanobrevibacter sp. TaxID=253161 RepID=UPI0025D6E0FD|nr:CPBP family glutamic-type intramembrane protease [uncultured Methanobrevibacter sp.]
MLNLDNDRDFPYYNEIPRMSKIGWLVLLICIPVSYFASGFISGLSNDVIGSIFFLLILLVPLLYFSNWDYSLFFQKPTRNEFILAVSMALAYFAYSTVFTILLNANGIPDVTKADANVVALISLVFSMMAEELIKFIPLMFLLRVFFKYTSNRRLSIMASSVITLIFFGLIHLEPTVSIISVLVVQGAGSIFHLYVYLKTKNLFVSYLSHLMTDASVLILIMFGLIG